MLFRLRFANTAQRIAKLSFDKKVASYPKKVYSHPGDTENALASHQVSDRLKRLTRFETQNNPSSVEQRTDSDDRRTMLNSDLKIVTHPHR
jgi:hypothetical protein